MINLGVTMRVFLSSATVLAVATGMLFAGTAGTIAAEKKLPANAVGAAWNTNVARAGRTSSVAGATFSEQQIALINKISAYFMALDNTKGKFVQTGANKKRMRGKFFIKRPGRFRFNYNRPSRMVVLSDGRNLYIQDHDLNTEDQISLKKTPFRMLMRKKVNILRDARIALLQETEDLVIIELLDKNPRVAGGIKLFLSKKPTLQLREWITTDVQGLKTRIELTKLLRVEKLSFKIFKHIPMKLPRF